jgi:hypothetical protein
MWRWANARLNKKGRKTMKIKNILGIVTAFSVFITAVSGHTTTSHRKSVHFTAPTGAYQKKVNGTDAYEPPRSPGYNTLTES